MMVTSDYAGRGLVAATFRPSTLGPDVIGVMMEGPRRQAIPIQDIACPARAQQFQASVLRARCRHGLPPLPAFPGRGGGVGAGLTTTGIPGTSDCYPRFVSAAGAFRN